MIIILILQLLMQLFLMNELACWLKKGRDGSATEWKLMGKNGNCYMFSEVKTINLVKLKFRAGPDYSARRRRFVFGKQEVFNRLLTRKA